MRNQRAYYSASIQDFLCQPEDEIFGIINSNDLSAETPQLQRNTWKSEIKILKGQLRGFYGGKIIFEYTIPRMGKRVDVVLLYKNIVFLIEFKCGDTEYRQSTSDQVCDYALDLRNFQKESLDKLIVPIMVSTEASARTCVICEHDRILEPICSNANNISNAIHSVTSRYNDEPSFDYDKWENSTYYPTPTIVEAAQALYQGHNVHDITIVITRNLNKSKEWVRKHSLGTTRYGLLASSGALRLKPEGIFVKNEISVANWFLNGKDDVRSSYALEDIATEFDIQGLELDYSIVAWDADFRFYNNQWNYHNFVGNRWNTVNSEEKRIYLENAYRVLLTRARQGMAIFIPIGDDTDISRKKELYDRTYNYLKGIGIEEL